MPARLCALAIAAALLAACNTIEGIGRDVRAGGDALERSAQDVKRRM